MSTVEERFAAIEQRLDALEGRFGYVCAGCRKRQSKDHFYYTATNLETKRGVSPLCAPCVRGGLAEVMGKPWKHHGPYRQPVTVV